MLYEQFLEKKMNSKLLSWEEFRPYPSIDERDAWDHISPDARDYWIREAKERNAKPWPQLSATQFMNYSRTGDRIVYDELYFQRRLILASIVVAECIENEGTYVLDILNAVWSICEESFWGIPAHIGSRALPDVTNHELDLFAAETAGLLAWTISLVGTRLDKESPLIRERVEVEVKQRIFDPYLNREDFWWMGVQNPNQINNWTAWIHSNTLAAFLLLERDAKRREEAIGKSLKLLDLFLNSYHDDGGCDEGPSYWNRAAGSLFRGLELVKLATNGEFDVYHEPKIRAMGQYIYRVHIQDDYMVNFADSPARIIIDAATVFRYGKAIGDEHMISLAVLQHHAGQNYGNTGRIQSLMDVLPAIFLYEEMDEQFKKNKVNTMARDVWMDGIEVMVARERQDASEGLYVAAKGGHNAENHNHNDIGQFIVYANGKPMIIDVGVGQYTAKTFSPKRYEIWTMQSNYHNLPVFEGNEQMPGKSYHATDVNYTSDDNYAALSMNIASAYSEEAGICYWNRSIRLNRGEIASVEVIDNFRLEEDSDKLALSVMTPHIPDFRKKGIIRLTDAMGNGINMAYDHDVMKPDYEEVSLQEDIRLLSSWNQQSLYRIMLRTVRPVKQGEWKISVTQV